MKQKTIVISGINMVEGGIFTILDNCLQKISAYSENKRIKIIALIHDKSKFDYPNIEYIEFPRSKKSWFLRLYYEYFYFKKLSMKIKPDIWFSLHDISPNVVAKNRFVYCHHPTVFYKSTFKDWRFDYKIGVFSIFYKYLYQINIRKNKAVFVQQHWIKKEFETLFSIKNVVTCHPEFTSNSNLIKIHLDNSKIHFFYPLISKSFKNIESIGEAVKLLPENIKSKIKIHLTISEGESNYANYIIHNYNMAEMNYIGKISREEVFGYYKKMDCLLFPSKLETWGLPLTESKAFKKPIFAANLPYAKETVGDYDTVCFFDINAPEELASLITKFVNKTIIYQGNKTEIETTNQLNNWFELFDFILKEQ
ncbi:glycosyltransferase family 4 protein [Flavobacterium sp. ZT3R18]|uniref:glycosyltransferase n=1 Tax=Flavobacterium sp. ZT3R18 TaxID=2594429 RepID=UPI00117A8682|nr:glycosyltransferase [Flavobacterium sp. ZT3R18]TRX32428.1 glycosyltransferase family 4 protein [Flavobacterium sp. ZT3R18]